METEPIEFKRNNSNRVESIPGRIKCGNIEFTKVVNLGGDSFSQWREQIEAGDDAFRTIQVHLHHVDMSADPVMSVTLHNAWPIKWEFPELSGSSSDAAIEKITFDVSHITRN
jgi:phage tail-like protein